jgi:Trk-type K+ transport system membrane component
MGLLNRLHHLNGFEHSSATMNAWGWILAWTSIMLILLGGTGVYMWFRIYTERRIGSILLATNLCVSMTLLIPLRTK